MKISFGILVHNETTSFRNLLESIINVEKNYEHEIVIVHDADKPETVELLFQYIEKVTGKILWANLHFLFWLSLIPFTTSWVGENHLDGIQGQIRPYLPEIPSNNMD